MKDRSKTHRGITRWSFVGVLALFPPLVASYMLNVETAGTVLTYFLVAFTIFCVSLWFELRPRPVVPVPIMSPDMLVYTPGTPLEEREQKILNEIESNVPKKTQRKFR